MKISIYGMAVVAISFCGSCTDNTTTNEKAVAIEKTPHKNVPHIIERHACMADLGLLGKVKSMSTKRYMLSGDKKILSLSTYSLFDDRGNITECRVDKTANNPAMSYKSLYDANSNDTLTMEYYANGKEGDKTVSSYDKWGNMLTRKSYHNDGKMWDSQAFKYDDKDSMTDVYSERIMQAGILKVTGTYKYDAKGRLSEGILEYGGGGIAQQYSKGTNTYNADGKLRESKEYDREGKLTKRSEYRYDKAGKQTGLSEYNADGSLREKWEYTFDEKGNATSTNIYDANGKLTDRSYSYDYEYDSMGNIIKKTSYYMKANQRTASEVEETQLTYY